VAARARVGQYEPVFRDNDSDGAVLPSLTTEDLKDLGIASVGHRRRLLEAIAAPREGDEPTRPTAVADAAPSRLVMAGDRGSPAGRAFEAEQEFSCACFLVTPAQAGVHFAGARLLVNHCHCFKIPG
jgi:SAM domain (Sterile alpha motif)